MDQQHSAVSDAGPEFARTRLRGVARNVIITGGSGFIGGRLADSLLNEGHTVTSMDVVPPAHPSSVSFFRHDIREPIPSRGDVETVIHLAALSRDPGYQAEEYFETNVAGTANVLNFASVVGAKHVIFASTMMVFAAEERAHNVGDSVSPDTPYGESKARAEELVRDWSARSSARIASIIRPAVVFGPGDSGNFEQLRRLLSRGFFLYPGRRDTVKSCVFIDDVVGFVASLVADPVQGTFHLSVAPAPTIEDIVSAIATSFGYKVRATTAPYLPLHWTSRLIGRSRHLSGRFPLTVRRVEKLTKSTHLVQDLGAATYQLHYPTLERAVHAWASATRADGPSPSSGATPSTRSQ